MECSSEVGEASLDIRFSMVSYPLASHLIYLPRWFLARKYHGKGSRMSRATVEDHGMAARQKTRKWEVFKMFRISYFNIQGTQLYKVTLHDINQTIVVSRGFLASTMGMHPHVVAGCKDLTVHAIIDLGFVFPSIHRKIVI